MGWKKEEKEGKGKEGNRWEGKRWETSEGMDGDEREWKGKGREGRVHLLTSDQRDFHEEALQGCIIMPSRHT